MSLLSTALTLSGQAGPEIGSLIGIAFIQMVFLQVFLPTLLLVPTTTRLLRSSPYMCVARPWMHRLATFVIPLMQQLCLAILWAAPLTLRAQKKLLFFVEVLAGWASIEVFVGSVVAALLQLGQFAAFMVGDACSELDRVLQDYFVVAGIVVETDATCFNVSAELIHPGYILLFLCSLISVLVSGYGLDMCKAAVGERAASEELRQSNRADDAEPRSAKCSDWILRALVASGLAFEDEAFVVLGSDNLSIRNLSTLPAVHERL